MALMTDQSYLRNAQYKTSVNLTARANLHVRFGTNLYGWMKWAFDQLELRPGLRVLEVGGGPGSLWRENLHRLPSNLCICFSDFSLGMVQEAQPALGGDGRFAFANLDAQAIPLPDGFFDVVIANHMLYHVPDLPRAVGELARVLKAGGRLYAATNGLAHLREIHELIHEFNLRYEGCDPAARLFGLENAAEILGQRFAQVEIRRYEDALWVTEARPLTDYILSTWGITDAAKPMQAGVLEEFLQSKIEANGGIRIAKDTGMAIGLLG